MSAEPKSPRLFGGVSNITMILFGAVVIAAIIGWSKSFSAQKETATARAETAAARADTAALQATLAAAGLDAATPQVLDASIAAKRRELTRLDSALVAKSAAVGARDRQLASVGATVARLESAATTAAVREREAEAAFDRFDDENRLLSRRVAELTSAAVSWEAAATVRREELDGLLRDVAINQALIADAAMWRSDSGRLTAEKDRLAREVIGLENQVVTLAAAVAYRQSEVAAAAVALSTAEADERQAFLAALDLRAESADLHRAIVDLTAERDRINKALISANNRLVPALAAADARERQLQQLSSAVAEITNRNAELTTQNADMSARMVAVNERIAQLTQAAAKTAEYLAAIDEVLETPTVQAALAD